MLDAAGAELAAPTGRLRADLHVEGAMPLDGRSLADAITASGQAQLRAEALTLPGVARGIDGAGELAFSWQAGQAGCRAVGHSAPSWNRSPRNGPPSPSCCPRRGGSNSRSRPASRRAWRDDGFQLQGSGRITLATAGPQLEATFSATVALDPHGRMRELVVRDGEIDVRDLRVAGMRLERGSIKVQGTGAPEAWEGSLALELAGAGAPWPGLELEGATAQADLDVRLADGRLSLSPRAPATLQLAKLSWADDVRINGLEVRVPPSAGAAAQRRAGGRSNAMAAARARQPANIRGDRVGRQGAAPPDRRGRRAGVRAGRRRAGPA